MIDYYCRTPEPDFIYQGSGAVSEKIGTTPTPEITPLPFVHQGSSRVDIIRAIMDYHHDDNKKTAWSRTYYWLSTPGVRLDVAYVRLLGSDTTAAPSITLSVVRINTPNGFLIPIVQIKPGWEESWQSTRQAADRLMTALRRAEEAHDEASRREALGDFMETPLASYAAKKLYPGAEDRRSRNFFCRAEIVKLCVDFQMKLSALREKAEKTPATYEEAEDTVKRLQDETQEDLKRRLKAHGIKVVKVQSHVEWDYSRKG